MDSIYEYLNLIDEDEIRILFRKAVEEVAYLFLDEHPGLLELWEA